MGGKTENAPLFFSSEYRFGIDPKRRVQIPAKWRGVSIGETFTLLVWRKKAAQGACLLALPPLAMSDLMQKLRKCRLRTQRLKRFGGRSELDRIR